MQSDGGDAQSDGGDVQSDGGDRNLRMVLNRGLNIIIDHNKYQYIGTNISLIYFIFLFM